MANIIATRRPLTLLILAVLTIFIILIKDANHIRGSLFSNQNIYSEVNGNATRLRGWTPPEIVSIRIMTFNIWYGGEQVNLDDTVDVIVNAKPDIVGLQECDVNLLKLAELCHLPYVDERRFIISRFPIFDSGLTGRRTDTGPMPYAINGLDPNAVHAWILIAPGKVIAFANTHMPWDPYGPDLVAAGGSPEEVAALEEAARGEDARALSSAFADLARSPVPLFLTGDFNSPSHLDWTEDMVGSQPQIRYPFDWVASKELERIGMIDTFRSAHPHPHKKPGITFGPGQPAPVPLHADQYRDRIDFIYASGSVEVGHCCCTTAGDVMSVCDPL